MSTLATMPQSTDSGDWTAEEKAVVEAAGLVFKHTWGDRHGQVELAPRAVIAKFKHTCERTGLDPLARQIYCIGRFSSGGVEWAIQTAIDGFRVIAERSGKYAGQDAPEWLTAKGEWVQVFVKQSHGEHPLAARISVYRHDWKADKPAVGIATWDEYAQTTKKGDLTAMWRQRGAGQLAKCAEALALRKAFPQDLAGLYTDDEMQDRVEAVEVEPSGIDWAAEIEAATTVDELRSISARIKEAGEMTDKLRAQGAARLGMMSAQETEAVDDSATFDSTEWMDRLQTCASAVALDAIYEAAQAEGVLQSVMDAAGSTLNQMIMARKRRLQEQAEASIPDDAPVAVPEEPVSDDDAA